MKIAVFHPGKQHVNALLIGLEKRGVLAAFLTMMAANRFWPLRFLPKRWARKFDKYRFSGIDEGRIGHAPGLFFLFSLLPSEYWAVRLPYDWFDRWAARRLARADFDIVIGYENTTLYTFTMAKRLGRKTVLDLAGLHHHFQNPILTAAGSYRDQREVDFISKKKDAALAVTDHVITLSKFGQRALAAGGFPAERVSVTYLGIDHSVFFPKKEYRPGGQLKIYFVGTMSLRKGLPFAVELVESLRQKGLDVHLTLIGPVDDFDPAGLDEKAFSHIPFIPQPELVALHHALDLFIFPSNMDSWAQTVVEAMACGSPVLVSAHTGAQDAVEQGGGFVLPVGDLAAWEGAVEVFYRDRSLLKKHGEKAAEVARQYTWEAYHEQVFAAMERALFA